MRNPMLRDIAIATGGGFTTMFLLALIAGAFGFHITAASPTSPSLKTVALPARPWVQPDPLGVSYNKLVCADSLDPVEVALGSHNDSGSIVTYSLTPHAGDNASQKSVTLKVTAPRAVVVTAIVHASGSTSDGRSDDTQLTLNVPVGGQASQTLLTKGYVYSGYDDIYSIVSVTLCTEKG